jgi:hypothetical protein
MRLAAEGKPHPKSGCDVCKVPLVAVCPYVQVTRSFDPLDAVRASLLYLGGNLGEHLGEPESRRRFLQIVGGEKVTVAGFRAYLGAVLALHEAAIGPPEYAAAVGKANRICDALDKFAGDEHGLRAGALEACTRILLDHDAEPPTIGQIGKGVAAAGDTLAELAGVLAIDQPAFTGRLHVEGVEVPPLEDLRGALERAERVAADTPHARAIVGALRLAIKVAEGAGQP